MKNTFGDIYKIVAGAALLLYRYLNKEFNIITNAKKSIGSVHDPRGKSNMILYTEAFHPKYILHSNREVTS